MDEFPENFPTAFDRAVSNAKKIATKFGYFPEIHPFLKPRASIIKVLSQKCDPLTYKRKLLIALLDI